MQKRKYLYFIAVAAVFAFSAYFYFNEDQHVVSKTAIVHNPISSNHTRSGEPESALRLEVIIKKLKAQNVWQQLSHIKGRQATDNELELVHSKNYVSSIKNWSQKTAENSVNRDKWAPYQTEYAYESAATAVGGLIVLSESVARQEFQNGFAIIRPPGHHALKNKGMGYCIFNNIAIATINLLNKKLAQKILIFDIDAHHGNGIEDIFRGSRQVFYVSLHQKHIFPYSPHQDTDNIKNIKLNFLETEENYKKYFETALSKAIEDFKPDFIFVSAGYDTHWKDYMSNLGLSLLGQSWASEKLVQAASKYSQNKIVFSLEGGYNLEALSYGVSNSIKALLGRNDFIDPIGPAPP